MIAAMTMVKKIRSGKVFRHFDSPISFVCLNFCRKKAAPRNFHLAGLLRLPLIGAILAQIDPTHNTLWTLSPVLRKILHKRPGTSGQLCCDFPWQPSPKGTIVRTYRTEIGILHVLSAVFQELHNFIFLSLCTLRIDKSIRNMYNKARNQRSTAEAQRELIPLT